MWNSDSDFTRHTFRCFDFDITYVYRPDETVYQEILPTELMIDITIPDSLDYIHNEHDKQELLEGLRTLLIAELDQVILFDTPDAPEFEVEDVSFNFEEV